MTAILILSLDMAPSSALARHQHTTTSQIIQAELWSEGNDKHVATCKSEPFCRPLETFFPFSKVSAEASSTVVLFPVLLASSKSNPRLEACFEFWTLCFSLATKVGSSFKV